MHLGDRLVFKYYYDANRISTAGSVKLGGQVELGKVTLDQWIDFTVRIRWDYNGGGYLELNRKDRVPGATWERIFKQTNGISIGYNDVTDPQLGIGIYKFDAGRQYKNNQPLSDYYRRRVHFDAIRIGNENSTPVDVIPR